MSRAKILIVCALAAFALLAVVLPLAHAPDESSELTLLHRSEPLSCDQILYLEEVALLSGSVCS